MFSPLNLNTFTIAQQSISPPKVEPIMAVRSGCDTPDMVDTAISDIVYMMMTVKENTTNFVKLGVRLCLTTLHHMNPIPIRIPAPNQPKKKSMIISPKDMRLSCVFVP